MFVYNYNYSLFIKSKGYARSFNYSNISELSIVKERDGDYKVKVEFSNGSCPYSILLKDVTNQLGWTNSLDGANQAIEDLSSWMSIFASGLATEATLQEVNAGIPASLGQKNEANSMPVTIASNQNNGNTTPNFIRVTGSGSIASTTISFSVANVGVADGIFLGSTIKVGEVLNFSAGPFRTYVSGSATYDATGTEFIIIYNT